MASLADSLRFSVACRRPPWTDEPRWHWKYENVFPSLGQPAGKGEVPSLAKEGTPRHQVNGPFPLEARPGWFVQLPIIGGLNQPPRLRLLRRLRGIFLMGAATPPCPRRGLRLSLQSFSMPPCPAKDVTWQAFEKRGGTTRAPPNQNSIRLISPSTRSFGSVNR